MITAAEGAAAVRVGQLSARELVERALAAIDERDGGGRWGAEGTLLSLASQMEAAS